MEEREMIDNIVNIMSGQFDMSSVMSEIMESVNKVTEEKFLSGIKGTFDLYKQKSLDESRREVNLLNALKAFIPESNRSQIDQVTNLFGEINAINNLIKDIQHQQVVKKQEKEKESKQKKSTQDYEDSLIIEDNTIYEIDRECQGRVQSTSFSGNSMLPLLLILLSGFSGKIIN